MAASVRLSAWFIVHLPSRRPLSRAGHKCRAVGSVVRNIPTASPLQLPGATNSARCENLFPLGIVRLLQRSHQPPLLDYWRPSTCHSLAVVPVAAVRSSTGSRFGRHAYVAVPARSDHGPQSIAAVLATGRARRFRQRPLACVPTRSDNVPTPESVAAPDKIADAWRPLAPHAKSQSSRARLALSPVCLGVRASNKSWSAPECALWH